MAGFSLKLLVGQAKQSVGAMGIQQSIGRVDMILSQTLRPATCSIQFPLMSGADAHKFLVGATGLSCKGWSCSSPLPLN